MPTPSSSSFGLRLRRQRHAAGLTQEELAARAGMSAHGIADLEAGRRRSPRRDTVALLADALSLVTADRAAFEAAARQKPTAAPVVMSTVPRGSTGGAQLVGREGELALLARNLTGDAPPLLVFAGEPGIGKTRLLREAAQRAAAQGWEVLAGGCHRRSGQEPYTPLLSALERHLAARPLAQQRQHLKECGWLVRLLPELAETGAISAPPQSLPPDQERRLMFAAAGRYLANVAGPCGTLLVLDDLQWAATDALDLLAALLRAHAVAPLRILAAYRDTEVRRHEPLAILLADLARQDLAARVPLGPLSLAEAQTLLDDVLPGDTDGTQIARRASSGLKQRMVMRTGGIPYFLLSWAQAVVSNGLAGSAFTSSVPVSVADTIRQRVGVLAPETQAVLETAAIIGRVVPRALLLRVVVPVNQPEETVLSALDVACEARLLREQGEHAYQFTHDLVREVIGADMSAARRMQLHRQVAGALERGPEAPSPGLLAEIYRLGDVPEKAAEYLEKAGEHAGGRFAYAEAQSYFREAAARLDELDRAADAARIRERLADILVIQARYDAALEALASAADTYRISRDEEGLGRVTAQLGQVHALRGTPQDGIALVEPLLKRAVVNGLSPRTIAAMSVALARLSLVRGRYDEQLTAAERAAAHARVIHNDAIIVEAEFLRGWALIHLGHVAAGLQCLESVMSLAEAAGDMRYLATALVDVAWGHGLTGAFTAAQPHMARALAVAEHLEDKTLLAHILSVRSMIAFPLGEWDLACADGERAIGMVHQIGPTWRSMMPRFCMGQLGLARGDQESALANFEAALNLATACGDLRVARLIQSALAERDLLQGQPDRALQRLLPLLDRFGEQEILVTLLLPLLAWAHLDIGADEEAEIVIQQAIARARAQGLRVSLVDGLRVKGLQFVRQERWQAAAEVLDEALELARATPYPYAEAKTLYVYGLLYRTQGESEPARARLAAALAILNRLGERLFAEHVVRALAGDE